MSRITNAKAKEIFESLEWNYTAIDTSIQNINRGGCGIFAEELYNLLLDLGFKPKLVILANDYDKDNLVNAIRTNMPSYYMADNDIGFSHIMISTNGHLIDSNGVHESH